MIQLLLPYFVGVVIGVVILFVSDVTISKIKKSRHKSDSH